MPFVSLPAWSKPRPRAATMQSTKQKRIPTHTRTGSEAFGIPVDDPDPFGVLALERAGLEIREAGTKTRPPSDAFEYRPSPTSPVFSTYARHSMQSVDGVYRDVRRDSRRDSKRSVTSVDQGTQTTDLDPPPLEEPAQAYSPKQKDHTEQEAWIIEEDAEDHFEEEPDVIIEECRPTIQVITRAMKSPVTSRAKLVTIPKRIPPVLPQRSPLRRHYPHALNAEIANASQGTSTKDEDSSQYSPSPTRSGFDKNSMDSPNPWSEQTSLPDMESMRFSENGSPCHNHSDAGRKSMDDDNFSSLSSPRQSQDHSLRSREDIDELVEEYRQLSPNALDFDNIDANDESQLTLVQPRAVDGDDDLHKPISHASPQDGKFEAEQALYEEKESTISREDEVFPELPPMTPSEFSPSRSPNPSRSVSSDKGSDGDLSPATLPRLSLDTEDKGGEIDEFHSMPSTPLDVSTFPENDKMDIEEEEI